MAPLGKLELVTPEWLRRSLDASPAVFALQHVINDGSGCFRELEARTGGADDDRLGSARVFASRSLDTLGVGATVIDRGGQRVHAMNHAFARLFSIDGERSRDRHLAELVTQVGGDFMTPFLASASSEARVEERQVDVLLDGQSRKIGFQSWHIEHTRLALVMTSDATEPTLSPVDLGMRSDLLSPADGVAIIDGQGQILFANPGLHRLFGYEPGELVGTSAERLALFDRPASPLERHPPPFAAPTLSLQGDGFVGRRKDGTQLVVALSMHRTLVGAEPVMLCFVSDVERRQQSAERLRELNEHLQRTGFEAATSAEQERRRLATELHDGLGQSLVLASMQLRGLAGSVLSPAATAAITQAMKLLDEASAEARAMTFELSPPVLYDLGLGPALSWLVEDLHRRHGLSITLVQEPIPYTLHEVTASVVFRSIRELLINALKHAGTGQARVEVILAASQLVVMVQDDGAGFDAPQVFADAPRGFGLHSVREQLARVGGHLHVESAVGRGTRVTLRVLLPSSGEAQPRLVAR